MKAEPQGPGLLAALVAEAERRAGEARRDAAALERRAAQGPEPRDFGAALRRGSGVAVIAEIKRRSPSAGDLWKGGDVASLAARLAEGGASALSVLTESAHFGGSLEDLSLAAGAAGIPVLRKDFVVDPVQLYEARAHGAAAVLLIARILRPERLAELADVARRLGLATVVEVHGAGELEAALAAAPTAVGVNARDLDTLRMDRTVVDRLVGEIPGDLVAVAESGLASREDVETVARRGADAVLIGTAISGASDPAAALRALTGVARHPRPRGRGGREGRP